ncbi:MAG: FtsX-like permease family protein [Saprospiraceae bacterium]
MINHLFKLIWKKKRANFLMMLEFFISFMILFAVWTICTYYFRNFKQPDGITADRVWAVFTDFHSDTLRKEAKELINQRLIGFKEIESFSFSNSNIPFSFSNANRDFSYQKLKKSSEFMHFDPSIEKVLGLQLVAGRWYEEGDKTNKNKPILINRNLSEALFKSESPLGKLLEEDDSTRYRIIGVLENFKFKSDFEKPAACVFIPTEDRTDVVIIKLREDVNRQFEVKLTKELTSLGNNWEIEVQHMDEMKKNKNQLMLVPILILFIISTFLIINVALGIFGVLFQVINQRKGEIGIRRAVGANQHGILIQFIMETVVIATLSIILGIFFAIQFPLLNVFDVETSTYILGILLAVISIYLIVVVCAFLPSKQASKTYPALALHEE